MEHLSSSAIFLIVGGFLGWIGRGIGFVAKRWWTDSPKHDRASYLNNVADLAAKMRALGMSMEEVRQLEEMVQNPSVKSSAVVNDVVEHLVDDVNDPEAFQSNVAMKARTGAAYDVAEAKLKQALMDLRLVIGEHEWEHVEAAQCHWEAYRRALEDAALREYEGGTHATLAMALVGMAETERRADEIRAQLQDRITR